MEHRGPTETIERHCPRCCANQDQAPIDVGRELSDKELDSRKMWKEVGDLCLMYENWADGHIRCIEEGQEPNYSALEDYWAEFLLHSALYVQRLQEMDGYEEAMSDLIRGTLQSGSERIMTVCLEYEEKMRLGGTWNEKEEEIKGYWINQLGGLGKALTASTACKVKQIANRGEGRD